MYELSVDEIYEEDVINNEPTVQEPVIDEDEMNRFKIQNEISQLKNELSASDYKIIKCYKYTLVWKSCSEYDIDSIHAERDKIRDKINELEKMYKSSYSAVNK